MAFNYYSFNAGPRPVESSSEPPPVVSGSVIGYRAWRIRDWQLGGTGVNRVWVPGVNEATCDAGPPPPDSFGFSFLFRQHGGRAPGVGCHCGITALARFAEDDEHWTGVDVFGAIEAWGEEPVTAARPGDVADAAGVVAKPAEPGFILHRNGFRARYGKVVLLAVDDGWRAAKRAAVRALAREHSADVCRREHLEAAAKEHGQLVSDELLAWAAEADPDPSPAIGLSPALSSIYIAHSTITTGTSGLAMVDVYQDNSQSVRSRGISYMIGYPGPPADPQRKARKGERVRDSRNVVWVCEKGGKPGVWVRDEG